MQPRVTGCRGVREAGRSGSQTHELVPHHEGECCHTGSIRKALACGFACHAATHTATVGPRRAALMHHHAGQHHPHHNGCARVSPFGVRDRERGWLYVRSRVLAPFRSVRCALRSLSMGVGREERLLGRRLPSYLTEPSSGYTVVSMPSTTPEGNAMFNVGDRVVEVAYPDTQWTISAEVQDDGWVFAKEATTGLVLSFAPGLLRHA